MPLPSHAKKKDSRMKGVALVTGAGRGLGRILAAFLSGQGYDMVITARTLSELQEVSKSLDGIGMRVVAISGDITDPAHRTRLLQQTRAMGGLALLVNNASELGEIPRPELASASLDRFRLTLETNLVAPIALIQESLLQLEKTRGLVVNISSDASQGGYERWGIYGSSKAALDLASKTLAAELRPRHVSIVSVDPGDMRTRMHQDAYPGEDISDRPLPEVTLPFWAWLVSQDPARITGMRYQAQGTLWEIPA